MARSTETSAAKGGAAKKGAGARKTEAKRADAAASIQTARERDTTVTKIDSTHSPMTADGEKYLASGKTVAMRMWERVSPSEAKEPSRRPYETVGYVLAGRAELHVEGQMVVLEPGNSWVVPKGALHTYKVVETFTAIEATHPPYHVHGREE
jgi:mannose-6-phosphate isomerase-like protein (cupin superfamily)